MNLRLRKRLIILGNLVCLYTGCSLSIVFFPKILKYSGLWPFSVFLRRQCVYTHQTGRKPALQQNCHSSEKSQHFKEKKQIFNERPVKKNFDYVNNANQKHIKNIL